MDLTKAITYRGFGLNSLTKDANQNLVGCEIKQVEYPGVPGIGYDEKRALADGFDASDVFLGKRLFGLTGALYGTNRGEFFDLKQALMTALTPTAAYDQSPGDLGFLPLDYYEPTANTIDFPFGYIHKMVNTRPVRQPSLTIVDDTSGGPDGQPLAMKWTGLMECKDPRVYFFTPTEIDLPNNVNGGSGNLINRGDYPAPLNLLVLAAASTPLGIWHFVGAGSDLTITIPNVAYDQTFRYSARDKILTLEANGIESLRMDLLTLGGAKNHPLVPVGSSAYTWSKTTSNYRPGGRIWWYDSWA